MQGKRHDAIGRGAAVVVAAQELDVDVLVEGAGEPIARGRENPPPPPGGRLIGDCPLVRRIAQSK
jgi:hypothetical protein